MESFELNPGNINPSKLRETPGGSNANPIKVTYTSGSHAERNEPQKTTSANEPSPRTETHQQHEQTVDLDKHQTIVGITRFFADGRLRMFLGAILILAAGYMLVASINYLSHHGADQSIVINSSPEDIAANPQHVENSAGWFGAMLSHLLIYKWLGLGGFIIIFYIAAIGISLVKLHHFKFWQLTFKSLIAAIAVSIIAGFLTYWIPTPTFWGGEHGYWVNNGIISAASYWGAAAVSILMATAIVLIFLNPIRSAMRSIRCKLALHKQRMAERYQSSMAAAKAAIEHERAEKASQATQPATPDIETRTDRAEIKHMSKENVSENTVESNFTGRNQPEQRVRPTVVLDDIPAANHHNTYEEPMRNNDTANRHTNINETDIPTIIENREKTETEKGIDDMNNATTVDVTSVKIEEADDIDITAYDPTAELSHYRFPDINLLHSRENAFTLTEEEQEENNQRIISTLGAYGIKIESIKATVGPTITLYEIIPERGTRIASIKRLGDDMALSLSAIGIRIIAPIPGKGTIGMEVPNRHPQTVGIRSILSSRAFHESTAALPIALGTTIDNEVYVTDLAKMPHLLVAGATGMGKSVGLNTIIASLLYKKHPAELKFVLVDPKMVEFSLYKTLERHFLAKLPDEDKAIITDPTKVVATLNSLCLEMDNRYDLLSQAGTRGIKEYNQKFISRRLNPEKGHRYLPYIVVIIDEFADLILTAGKEVETPISRIAAKARAVGIHMILATQRPSVNVITGVIKANFPGRMAFRVTQMNDSRTILDRPGAEQLIGRGDMLISRDGVIDRVQCAFIDTDEVEAICRSISDQMGYPTAYELPEELPASGDGIAHGNVGDRDPMFVDAGRTVIEAGMGSASLLQRKFNIGYPRAGKLIDQLEAAGVVGASTGAGKPRPVLMDGYSFERMIAG